MTIENILYDASQHFLAGITLAAADYTLYRVSNPKNPRMEQKQNALESIAYILEVNENQGDTQSVEYAQNIQTVQKYLRTSGLVKMDDHLSPLQRMKDKMLSVIKDEKLNNLSMKGKFIFATFMEFGYDTILLGTTYYTQVVGKSPIAAFTNNIYQIPAFFGGLVVGKIATKSYDWIATTGDERSKDQLLKDLVEESTIVEHVLTYQPNAQVVNEIRSGGGDWYSIDLTRSGKKMFKGLRDFGNQVVEGATEVVENITESGERRKAEDQKRKDENRRLFDEKTAGH